LKVIGALSAFEEWHSIHFDAAALLSGLSVSWQSPQFNPVSVCTESASPAFFSEAKAAITQKDKNIDSSIRIFPSVKVFRADKPP
jgi:hypothetical protein